MSSDFLSKFKSLRRLSVVLEVVVVTSFICFINAASPPSVSWIAGPGLVFAYFFATFDEKNSTQREQYTSVVDLSQISSVSRIGLIIFSVFALSFTSDAQRLALLVVIGFLLCLLATEIRWLCMFQSTNHMNVDMTPQSPDLSLLLHDPSVRRAIYRSLKLAVMIGFCLWKIEDRAYGSADLYTHTARQPAYAAPPSAKKRNSSPQQRELKRFPKLYTSTPTVSSLLN